MALGAVTPVVNQATGAAAPVPNGPLFMTVTNVVGDSSYATGGSSLTPQQLGFADKVLFAQTEIVASTGSNCAAGASSYNTATNKLQCFANTSVEVAAAVNLSGITWQILAWGI